MKQHTKKTRTTQRFMRFFDLDNWVHSRQALAYHVKSGHSQRHVKSDRIRLHTTLEERTFTTRTSFWSN